MTTPAPESLPATTRAVVARNEGDKGVTVVEDVPTPKLRDDYVLVKTAAVALNPTDWKTAEGALGGVPVDCRVGCDYAGTVVAVGANVTQPFKVGDRIAGGAHGSNVVQPEDGAFAEYIVVKPDIAFAVPDSISDEEAATYGLCATTAAQGLFQGLKLATPWAGPLAKPETILIYGGAAATGIFGIQLAKLAGYRILATASPQNHEYLRSLGADAVFDYHDPEAALAGIREALLPQAEGSNGASEVLRYAWDCVSSKETAEFCAKALSANTPRTAEGAQDPESLHYFSLLPVPADTLTAVDDRICSGFTLYYTVFGEDFQKGIPFPANPEHLEFARDFWVHASALIASGTFKPARVFANHGGAGLEGVLAGLQELKEGKVSGGKLVYTVAPSAKPAEATKAAEAPKEGDKAPEEKQSFLKTLARFFSCFTP